MQLRRLRIAGPLVCAGMVVFSTRGQSSCRSILRKSNDMTVRLVSTHGDSGWIVDKPEAIAANVLALAYYRVARHPQSAVSANTLS